MHKDAPNHGGLNPAFMVAEKRTSVSVELGQSLMGMEEGGEEAGRGGRLSGGLY